MIIVKGSDSEEVKVLAVPDSSISVFNASIKTEIKLQKNYCLFVAGWLVL